MFRSQDFFEVASQIRGFFSIGRNSCDRTRRVTCKIVHLVKKDNGDEYEPQIKRFCHICYSLLNTLFWNLNNYNKNPKICTTVY